MAITVDPAAQLVVITDPQETAFVRDIWTAVQEFLAEPGGMPITNFLSIEGDNFVSDDGQVIQRVGLTLTIFQPWLIQFEAQAGPATEARFIGGGSLVGDSGTVIAPNADGTNPIAPSAFTQVTIAQSPSPTIENLTRLLTKTQFIALKD